MITSLWLKDFKNLDDEVLQTGPFTVIVGTNASGKSNIRDAFRFLHGVGRGYTLAEIIGGKYVGGKLEWQPIRGAPSEIAGAGKKTFGFGLTVALGNVTTNYFIAVGLEILGTSGFRILSEAV